MKNTLYASAFLIAFAATPVLAADDFGAPFTNQAPAGFNDVQPNDDTFNIDDFDPNVIEPAAGDEPTQTPESETGIDAQPETDAPQTSEPQNEISL